MSELELYYQAVREGSFAREDEADCGCGGSGWFLSQVDTWHACPFHHQAGQAHPEDNDQDFNEGE